MCDHITYFIGCTINSFDIISEILLLFSTSSPKVHISQILEVLMFLSLWFTVVQIVQWFKQFNIMQIYKKSFMGPYSNFTTDATAGGAEGIGGTGGGFMPSLSDDIPQSNFQKSFLHSLELVKLG